jgi:hypothetical protein
MLKKAVQADKYAPYKVVLPLSVRSFMRETGGELLPEDVPPPVKLKEFRKRRNFDDAPKFGTVNDESHVGGESGLVEEKTDPNQPRDYEAKLTYKKQAGNDGKKSRK